ncbi:hypothetical protein QM806_35280 [Rhodococcus sp. IEGM 1351]|uniref:hypothetical protein n=1 Tax=Rhodococcus sp. IEGM 1351 TaxID=3047089 RepID=UPI0024B862FD|nr:hypothetical protein [Rhodococcus sp. IEGM 1351]MDI9940628.1 hypothetical protein [Rhodococcus sp. IEGM 1351]
MGHASLDLFVEVEDPLGQGEVRVNHGIGGDLDGLTREVAHRRQPVGQRVEPA